MTGTFTLDITRVTGSKSEHAGDTLAVEEPLEISLGFSEPTGYVKKSISITMRTPGNDGELATGFLFTEGILRQASDIDVILPGLDGNTIFVKLNPELKADMGKLERHFYTSSSCGVCGKSSVEAVRTISSFPQPVQKMIVNPAVLYGLPDSLRKQQEIFESTGGLHASALFDASGNLVLLREDVGRHNALDKLIGAAFEKKMLPLHGHILLLSGRASFELIQKAAMAGIEFVAAVGAPSSLAVELAIEFGITLVGFLRGERFNIYSGESRIDVMG